MIGFIYSDFIHLIILYSCVLLTILCYILTFMCVVISVIVCYYVVKSSIFLI